MQIKKPRIMKIGIPSMIIFFTLILCSCSSIEEDYMKKECELRKLEAKSVYEKDNEQKAKFREEINKLSDDISNLKTEMKQKEKGMTDAERKAWNTKWRTQHRINNKECEVEIEKIRATLKN